MKEIINISDYKDFNELHKTHRESEAFLNILTYLLNKKYDSTDEGYLYYEKKYLEAYLKAFDEREKFSNYLKTFIKGKFNWDVNFADKEVTIIKDEE